MTALRLAIASGKGGTGKTTVAVGLALAAHDPVSLLDCDVEEPNIHLFLDGPQLSDNSVYHAVPIIDPARCNACGRCNEVCRFNAVAVPGSAALVFPELCHACGACALVCPAQAIAQANRVIGNVSRHLHHQVMITTGRLEIGQTATPTLIRAVLGHAAAAGLTIIDAPPGTGCAAVAALATADLVVLVTEPTPFGLHDLQLAWSMVRDLERPCVVVVNRCDLGDDRVDDWCAQQDITIVDHLPEDRLLHRR